MNKLPKTKFAAESTMQPEESVVTALECFKRNDLGTEEIDPFKIMEEVLEQSRQIDTGNTEIIERHLYAQGITLGLLFNELIIRMAEQDRVVWAEIYANLALRAQNQARITFTALSELKNPAKNTVIQQQITAITQQVSQE